MKRAYEIKTTDGAVIDFMLRVTARSAHSRAAELQVSYPGCVPVRIKNRAQVRVLKELAS